MTKHLLPASVCLAFLLSCQSPKNYSSYEEYPLYEGKDMELVYTPRQSVFTLWAPTAAEVRLNLYEAGEGGSPFRQIALRAADGGTWRATVPEDLKGRFYTFQIRTAAGWLDETPGIWAKAVGINGNRAAVIDWKATDPKGWDTDKAPAQAAFTDIILYEMHHRDFSVAANSGIEHKGKYLALTEKGTKGPADVSTGIDHLKELGVTHVHLLPSFDYASVDESRPEDKAYNWGYDPKNYNVPEGSYATRADDPVARIREFKQMVQSLHREGIRVIMDVVYNHTFTTGGSNFDLTVPGYFYRHNPDGSYSDASGCGNETASEREMVRRYIVESVKFWAREYHVDGFRFDLMGIHDLETMNRVKAELAAVDPTIFVYGEGWTAGDSPLPVEKRAVKVNAPGLKEVAVFSDDLRDALKGSVFEAKEAGFVSGRVEGNGESVKFGIVGAVRHPQIDYDQVLYCKAPYANQPSQVINYVSCHDDWCLVDKLRLSAPADMRPDEWIKFDKLAQTIVFTSQGVPFMRAGEELLHSKQGVKNSFQSPDSINEIDWSLKARHRDVFDYYRGLIALRKAHPAFRIPTAEGIRTSLRFLETADPGVIAYTLSGHANGDEWEDILVVFNGNRKAATVDLPAGHWTAVVCDGVIRPEGIATLPGGPTRVEASSALIMYR